ncbi:MAG: peptidyl-prolyl cis-trans isomerase [Armatimonadaceae bacterium]
MKKVLVALLALVAVASIAGNFLLYQRYSTSRPLMKIGEEAILVRDYRNQIDYEHGKAVLNKMAYQMLVMQEAKKAGVTPTEEDVDRRIADIRRRTPKALEEADGNKTKMEQLRKSLLADIALENLTIKDVKLSDAELRAFYNKNKQAFRVPTQARTTIVVAKNDVDAATAVKLLKDKSITPSTIATQRGLSVVGVNGFQPNWNAVPAGVQQQLSQKIFNAPVGGVTTVPVSKDLFLIARVDSRENDGVEPFDKVKPNVERLAKLTKAQPQLVVLAELYDKADVSFEVGKYAEYFKDMEALAKEAAKNAPRQTADAKTSTTQ